MKKVICTWDRSEDGRILQIVVGLVVIDHKLGVDYFLR